MVVSFNGPLLADFVYVSPLGPLFFAVLFWNTHRRRNSFYSPNAL